MKRDDQVQVWGDGPHEGDRRGPSVKIFEGTVESVGRRWITVRRPGMPYGVKNTFAFSVGNGRAVLNNSAMFLKLDEPVLWSASDGRPQHQEDGGPDAP